MPAPSLGTDGLRRLSKCSAGAAATCHGSTLTAALAQDSSSSSSPWAAVANDLEAFPTQRCVQMRPADWAELSHTLQAITRLCAPAAAAAGGPSGDSSRSMSSACFAHMLDVLQRLGRVTSCLLCVNGDDKGFCIARVAQAIRATSQLLGAALRQAAPAGLSAEVADRIARQRCEQTPLLSALAWALGEEARALFFSPRPTALSLATELLALFGQVQLLWPAGIFVPQQHEAAFDDAAARMAAPAAQLALAMLRCAGRALTDIGPGACKPALLAGLQAGYALVGQLGSLLRQQQQQHDRAAGASSSTALVKQLQTSPAMPALCLALLAVETQRLHSAVGLLPEDSIIRLQPKQQQQQHQAVADPANAAQQQQQELPHTPSQVCLAQQRVAAAAQREEEEHLEIEGAGELHQVWHAVLGMARNNLAKQHDAGQQQDGADADAPRAPLQQLSLSLGLPEPLLQLAAEAGVSPAPAQQQYVAVCAVGRFLLQGSPLLQPLRRRHDAPRPGGSAAAAAAAADPLAAGAVPAAQLLSPAGWGGAGRGAAALSSPFSSAAAAAAMPRSTSSAAGSPAFTAAAAAASGSPGPLDLGPLASIASLSPRATLLQQQPPDTALSLTAQTAEQLVEAARDYGLRGQQEVELLRLQRVVPVVLLDTAACLLQHHARTTAAAAVASSPAPAAQQQQQLPPADELRVVHAACTAAATVARCLPVLQRVLAQADGLQELGAGGECAPSAGVFAGLSAAAWQQSYEQPSDVHLPVLELLQLVVRLLWQLQPPWQQQAPAPLNGAIGTQQRAMLSSLWKQHRQQAGGPATALANGQQQQEGAGGGGGVAAHGSSSSGGKAILSPAAGECLDSLLEVLTAVSKLPREPVATGNDAAAGSGSSSASSEHGAAAVQAEEMQRVADAWQQQCQPVSAAVEACVRTAGQVAAAAAGVPKSLVQRHPSAVALGGCLAALCAPFGAPGPLVAAAAAAAPGGPEQQQLFALLASEVKLLLLDVTSKKAGLIAMHPLEQTPILLVMQLARAGLPAGAGVGAGDALLAWLLLLCRLLLLRGKLLEHLLATSEAAEGRQGMLHTAYHHVRCSEQSATCLLAHLGGQGLLSSGRAVVALDSADAEAAQEHTVADRRACLQQLRLQLLPALRHGLAMLRAAIKLSRHHHEAGFASGFASGFSAGYAAAVAATSSSTAAAGGSTPGRAAAAAAVPPPPPLAFASPWGVLQQACIRDLPAALQSTGRALAWSLHDGDGGGGAAAGGDTRGSTMVAVGCANPQCVDLSWGSEAWLLLDDAGAGDAIRRRLCRSCCDETAGDAAAAPPSVARQ